MHERFGTRIFSFVHQIKEKKNKDGNKQFKCGESVHCYNYFVLFLIVGLLVLFFGRWLHWVSGSFYGSYLSF